MACIRWSHWPVICLVFAMLLPASPVLALAQEPQSPTAGSRMRLKLVHPAKNVVQGDLIRLTSDSLHIVAAGASDTLSFATDSIARLEVSRGSGSKAGRGAVLGGLIGAGAGVFLGVVEATQDCTNLCWEVGPGEVLAVAALLGTAGAGLGALIGAMSRGERWEQVPRPWVGAQLTEPDRSFVVGLSVSW